MGAVALKRNKTYKYTTVTCLDTHNYCNSWPSSVLNDPSTTLDLKFQHLVLSKTEGVYIIPLHGVTTVRCTGASSM
jgi:hypothetical protein